MAQLLTDPILRDALRVVERHPDLTGEFKTRLMLGLGKLDAEVQEWRELAEPQPVEPSKRGKR